MRTMLVNPFYAKSAIRPSQAAAGHLFRENRRRRRRTRANIQIVPVAANPRRRRSYRRGRRRNPLMLSNPFRRRRRSAPNMLILPNRRRRRNPTMSLPTIVKNVAIGLGGAGLGFAANMFLIGKLGDDAQLPPGSAPTGKGMAIRGAVRIISAIAAAMLFPGSFATAFGGAVCYPIFKEFYDYWQARHPAVSGVSPVMGVDELNDVLDGY